MALDTQDIKLITGLQDKMEARLIEVIQLNGSAVRGKIESEVNRIDEMDEIRNGKIQHNAECIASLKKETGIARWVQRNKRTAVIIGVLTMLTVAFGYHTINFKRTVEKVLNIEFKEESLIDNTI